MDMPMLDKHCKCAHHKVIPVAIVLIGLMFLLQALNMVSAGVVAITWPILVIIIGLMKFTKGMCKCCKM
jgi:uncharacterized membrane protein (Fun14 family)